MQTVVYSQVYRAATPARQTELDACLARNRQHPGIDRLVLFREPDAPEIPPGPVPVELIEIPGRITYADWLRQVRGQGGGVALLLNADIQLGEGLAALPAVFDAADVFLALTRYNPEPGGEVLNPFPHWTQDVWGVRADAALPDSLLYASGFPLGFPGCDNRIVEVMWSHGFHVRNPCYHLRSLHRHADSARPYDKTRDRLYGGVAYAHPSLAPGEDSELEHTLWIRSTASPAGLMVNQQAVDLGVRALVDGQASEAERFGEQTRFTGLCWEHAAIGSRHLRASAPEPRSEHTVFLALSSLLGEGMELTLAHPAELRGFALRLPRRCPAGLRLTLEAFSATGDPLAMPETGGAELPGEGRRWIVQPAALQGVAVARLRLRLAGGPDPAPAAAEGAELVLFGHPGTPTGAAAPPAGLPAEPYAWWPRAAAEEWLAGAEEVRCYGPRLRVLRAGELVLFEDRFWPSLGVSRVESLPCPLDDARGLLLWGFAQPCLELRPDQFTGHKRFSADHHFWQYPCRTEEDAFTAHRALAGPQLREGTVDLYLGLPWATWIDRKFRPAALLRSYGSRVAALRQALREHQCELRVHSVCQHIRWREVLDDYRQAGVDRLWLSHAPAGGERPGGLELRPWPLYAVNAREEGRRASLRILPRARRRWLASFVGAHMAHYITDVRTRLPALAAHPQVWIELKDEWHFNPIVYGAQVEDGLFRDRSMTVAEEEYRHYNRILSESLFSLCPAGAGPNSLRLWESLSVGSVPVVLSDTLVLPEAGAVSGGLLQRWEEVLLFHPEAELESLLARLEAMPPEEIERRSALALALMRRVPRFTCPGVLVERDLPELVREGETGEEPAGEAGLSAPSPPAP